MVLNMDTELQRLICVSVEKMTRDPAASGSRKGRGLDLRKALLVAHVLQDMRTAYISDNYQILANTVCPDIESENEMEKIRRRILQREYHYDDEDVLSSRKRKFISDDWTTGSVDRPPRSEGNDSPVLTSQYRCPSGTQSCLMTSSDATMSKISQMTHTIPVSINTSYVLSHQTNEKDDDVTIEMDDDTPAVAEQVEVTSSDVSDSEIVETEIVQCEELLNNDHPSPSVIVDNSNEITVTKQSDLNKSQGNNRSSISCPLPRKKRPLPKEFLEPAVDEHKTILEQEPKRTKFDTTVTSSSCDVVVTSSYCILNTTTATTLTQSTALSSSRLSPASQTGASQSCSTLTYSVCTSSVSSTSTSNTLANSNSTPKVVVEMMNKPSSHTGLWPWSLPSTCTQPRLSRWLMDGVYRTQLADISNLRENSIHNPGMQGLVAF